ncbi:MAG: alginate lyase family protein [Bacteroidaceae bacterium]|nr:alginate lyase family protein [Bacteroidaceae bacterium]
MRVKTWLISLLTLMFAGVQENVSAQAESPLTENLIMQFNFENVVGTKVTDSISGIAAKTMGAASVIEMGPFHVLDLGDATGYLNMSSYAGRLVRQLEDFTISAYYCVARDASLSGNGYFLWSFSQLVANSETSSAYSAYRLNAQRMATSSAGWGSEVGMEVGTESAKGRWVHVLYRQTGSKGELFVDGKRVQQASDMPVLKNTFTANPANCWIGRAPFSDDNYLKRTLVSDFRLYNAAVTDNDIYALSSQTAALNEAYLYGTPGDFTSLVTKLQDCKDFIDSATEGYAPNSIAELREEMAAAQAEINAGRASQVLIDQYVASLQNLLVNAKNTKGYVAKQPMNYIAGQQGFVHPGALVTQADIDRAKKLIFEDKNEYMVRAWDILCANQYAQAGVSTWPTTYVQRGLTGDNYMNAARGAAAAYQNALRWKIGGDKAHADAAVRILMSWCDITEAVTGNTNISLAAGLYGYGFANAAELVRDYEGWSREDFERFKQWMVKVWYNPAIDFLRRRHDTWMNFRHPDRGERPGHYWSNWGLCNVLCVMSIGILCDDVHMYNQGVSFYKYDHQGTFQEDRSQLSMIFNDGCNEFIGNLVPVVLPDERGPFGYLGQMQESGRDQGHAVMALCCALDVCQIGFNQGDDLYAYMNDRIAAGCEYVCAQNFAGVAPTDLPWIIYEYADCAGPRGASWQQPCADSRGTGERRPNWDRIRGYYEGLRGVKLQYADKAAEALCPDGGGGNYNLNSGGFDHLGFSSLTNYRPLIDKADAITPLGGDIIYKGETFKNQTNLGGLKYKYHRGPTNAIPADGADITLIPQLPEGATDTGEWQWNTGETSRQITVKADHSYIYRVTYTAANGAQSTAAFAIAVAGDAQADPMRQEITVNGEIEQITEKTVLSGTGVILYAEAATGWTDDYLWDNGSNGTIITLNSITQTRTYTCQFANQSGAVSEAHFRINVIPARQHIIVDGGDTQADEATVFPGATVTLELEVPGGTDPQAITWSDGSHGTRLNLESIQEAVTATATYLGETYTYSISLKDAQFSYYTDLLTQANGYTHITSAEQLDEALGKSYFVICADEADLMLHLANGKENGNKALFYEQAVSPLADLSTVFTIEALDGGYCLRNIEYDGLLLQTEMNAAWNLRTHDQPYAISWAQLLMKPAGGAWTIENGTYPGNWLGLWTMDNGYADGAELACNKTGDEIGHFHLFAIPRERFNADYVCETFNAGEEETADITPLIACPDFEGNGWPGWTVAGTFGNQRFNGATETWHSTDFTMEQTLTGMPAGIYSVSCQLVNGEGENTGYLFAQSGESIQTAIVKQSCAGSDFDTQRNKMAANASYGRLSVDIIVGADGKLTFGLKEPSNDTTWLVFDNFSLTYNGKVPDGIGDVSGSKSADSRCYDLFGRRVSAPSMHKGIYIIGGKKVVLK